MTALHIIDCANTLTKTFIIIFAIYGFTLLYIYNIQVQNMRPMKKIYDARPNMKYILQWMGDLYLPFNFMGPGNSAFVKNNCEYTNCFVTDNRSLLNLADFDAIAFQGKDVTYMNRSHIPTRRSLKQKYIFATIESPHRFPVCNNIFDSFFNWTWTYKIDSTFRWGYMKIYDTKGNEIGPAIDMKWPDKMDPISDDLKSKLSRKSKAAAWFVSHCVTQSKRENFVADVSKELKKYGWDVDIYGSCGNMECTKKTWYECLKKVNDYYFYFSFENSFAEDYVTEKLLTALHNDAVPVVFGFANYSRFLPDGSYLDGRKLGPKNLARVMHELIINKTKYYEFFRWRNHFTYVETTITKDMCKLCEVLNDELMMNTVSEWKDFRKWWNGVNHKLCDDFMSYQLVEPAHFSQEDSTSTALATRL